MSRHTAKYQMDRGLKTVLMVLFTDWQETVQRKGLAHFVSTGRFDSADIYESIHMAITR